MSDITQLFYAYSHLFRPGDIHVSRHPGSDEDFFCVFAAEALCHRLKFIKRVQRVGGTHLAGLAGDEHRDVSLERKHVDLVQHVDSGRIVDHSVPVQMDAYLAVIGDRLLSLVDVEFQRASAVLEAILQALLEPVDMLRKFELEGDYTSRLSYLEELKSFPFSDVWDRLCEVSGVPERDGWIENVRRYEKDVLSLR